MYPNQSGKPLLACLLCISLSSFFIASNLHAQSFNARYNSMVPNSRAFYEYLPQAYSSESQSYPLIVFVHGVGELGDGSAGSLPTVLRNGPPRLMNNGTFPASFTVNNQVFKFIVISPQFINWPSSNDIQGVIDYAVRNYRVNTNRIYLTGLSMGGGVVWDYASGSATYANRLAALVPVCGASGSNTTKAQIIASANLPVWATHNQDDQTVPVSNTNGWINDINSSSPPPSVLARKSIFPKSDHDAWTTTYSTTFRENNLNIYEWMLQFQRGSSAPVNPPPPPPPPGISLPGRVEAENYTSMSGVQSETSSDAGGGNNIGYIDTGDWMDYAVSVSTAGTYTVNFRVASPYTNQQLQLKNASGAVLTTVNVPQTGAYITWTTVTATVTLPAGNQTLRVYSGNGGWNFNWMEFSTSQTSSGTAIPGIIESENYSNMSGVQKEGTSDAGGGNNVGYIDAGDWMDYPVSVSTAGTYTVKFRIANPNSNQQLQLKNSSGTVLTTLNIPQTGAYQSWTTATANVTLPAGNQTLRVYAANGGWNINWMEFTTSQSASGTAIPGMIESENYSNMSGIMVENTSDVSGSRNVGYVETGDWMDYAVSVSTAGTYTVNLRVACPFTNQQLQFKNASGAVLTTVNIPQTGAYITWTTVTATVTLPAGNQTLRVYSANGGWNINWMEFTTSQASSGTAIPGIIESENYSNMSGVQKEGTSDAGGGNNVGYIDNGDWMDYAVSVGTAGTYTVKFRIANPNSNQQLQLKNASGTVLTTLNIPQTGAYQSWTTATATVTLPAGNQTLRVYAVNGGWNINWMEFTTSQTASGTAIPGMIESENFSSKSGVDIENTSDVSGSKNVGYVDTGDWMDYAVSVSSAGTYTVKLRVASPFTNQQLQFKNASGAVLTTVNIPQTGAYITWTTITATVTLAAGNQTLRVYSANGGWNINWMEFTTGSTGSNASTSQLSGLATSGENILVKPSFGLFPNPVIDKVTLQLANTHQGAIDIAITNQSGTLIKTFRFLKDQNNTKLNLSLNELAPGIYFIKVKIGTWSESKKLIKM